jgi:hypothetical protein
MWLWTSHFSSLYSTNFTGIHLNASCPRERLLNPSFTEYARSEIESSAKTDTFVLFTYGSTVLCWILAAFSVSQSYAQSSDGGSAPSQSRYLCTEQHRPRINAHRHPCLQWDSNLNPSVRTGETSSCLRPRGQCDRPHFYYDTKNSVITTCSKLCCQLEASNEGGLCNTKCKKIFSCKKNRQQSYIMTILISIFCLITSPYIHFRHPVFVTTC